MDNKLQLKATFMSERSIPDELNEEISGNAIIVIIIYKCWNWIHFGWSFRNSYYNIQYNLCYWPHILYGTRYIIINKE